MSRHWPSVPLAELLTPVRRAESVNGLKEYRLLGVRLEGRGPFLRETVPGSRCAAARLFRVEKGDLIYSRLFAWRGAFGVIGSDLDGGYVSGEFPTFLPRSSLIDTTFLQYWFQLPSVLERVAADCSGSTPLTRNRFKETFFLKLQIPLPPLPEQQRIVARIENLATQIGHVRTLRAQTQETADAMIATFRAAFCGGHSSCRPLGTVCSVVDPNPSHRYPSYVDCGVPMVSSSEFVGDDSIDWSRARRVPQLFYQETLGRFGVGEGDVIFSRKGKLGYARPHPGGVRLAMTHTLCVLQPDRTAIEPRYLLHLARSSSFLDALAATMNPNVGVPTLGLGVIRDAVVPVPSLSEQRLIADQLDSVEGQCRALVALQTEVASTLDALLPAILDRAFKGEL